MECIPKCFQFHYEGFEITHLFLSQSFRCLSLCLHLCSAVAVPYPLLLLFFILASLEAPSTSFKPLSSHLGPENIMKMFLN